MRIIITGATGFVGTNLLPMLKAQGHFIIGIDNFSQSTWNIELHKQFDKFYKNDIRDDISMDNIFFKEKPDVVFHFAGLVSIYDCHKNTISAANNNIIGSINIFNAALAVGCKRVIFSESSAVYENCPLPKNGFKEDQSSPTTFYSTSKACVALIAESYKQTRGLEYTALRYFNIAGPIQDYTRTVPPLFAGVALRLMGGNNPIIFGDITRERDFIHIDDVNYFHLMCLNDKRTINNTFNLGTGISFSLFDIAQIIHDYLKIDKKLEFDFKEEINGEAHIIYADNSFAKSIGWIYKKSIFDAIYDTIDYLKKEIEKGNIDPKTYMNNLNTSTIKI